MCVPAHVPLRAPPRPAPNSVILGHARPGMVRCSRWGELGSFSQLPAPRHRRQGCPAYADVPGPGRPARNLVFFEHARPGTVGCSRWGEPASLTAGVKPNKLSPPQLHPKLQAHLISQMSRLYMGPLARRGGQTPCGSQLTQPAHDAAPHL
jgi:hypothetical protein